jgi:ATP adenylyltransferase
MNKPYLTAIKRNKPSAPVKWLESKGYVDRHKHFTLDFGCGRGDDVKHLSAQGYDPYWAPDTDPLQHKYDVVLCTYVLNVLPPRERKQVVEQIKSLLNDQGKAYVTVRRDLGGIIRGSSRGTQYTVLLKEPVLKQNSQYCIYQLMKG